MESTEIMDQPLVSVVIPVFNAERYIRECLDSVIGSTLKEIEIICIDDGSTDNSLTIVKEYEKKDSRIRVLTQAHSYAGSARNAGLAAARGEFVHFLDADDWIDRQAYEKWYRLAKDNGAEVCECIHYDIDIQNNVCVFGGDKGSKERRGEYFYITNFAEDAQFLAFGNVVPWNKIYLRKFLLDNEIWFDNLICAEDRSFYFAVIYRVKRIAFVLEPWLYHRVNNKFSLDGSDIRLQNFDVHFQSFKTIWNMMQHADDREKRLVLNACINDSFHCYRKSAGTKYEKAIQDKLYNFWSKYIPVLGDDIFEADWLAGYLEISGERSLKSVVIQPLDLARKTFVFAFDEIYVKYFSVALCSLLTHANPDDRYEIIVLYDQISEEKRKILQKLVPDNFIMRFIRVTVYVNVILGDLKAKLSSDQWAVSTFYDLLVPLLMPGYERILCCDSDIIFNKNPDAVFSMPFEGKELIAVQDTAALAYVRYPDNPFLKNQVGFINRELGISDLKSYFNGGILLFNVKSINVENYLERTLQALSFPVLPTVDQDALNYIFRDKVKLIPLRFNYQYHLFSQNSEQDFPNGAAYEYFNESRDPVIVHYITPDKPWKNPGCAFGWMFWQYARMSPFYEEIIYENLIVKQDVSIERKSLNEELNDKNENELEELRKLREETKQLKAELASVKTGWSFKIGRFLTWIPRKLLGRP